MCTSVHGVTMMWYFQHKVQEVAYSFVYVVQVVCSQVCICCRNDIQWLCLFDVRHSQPCSLYIWRLSVFELQLMEVGDAAA